jgi:hypothetical protein
MLRSNILKTTPYPEEFTEEDKANYDVLYAQAKVIHPEIERDNKFIIHMAIIAHIRQLKGMTADFTDEELEAVRASYQDYSDPASKIVTCEEAPDHYIYDKENNPIYFPSTLTISSDETDKQVVLESASLE